MSLKNGSFVCSRRKERGQVLPIVALWMVFFLGMAALAIDVGSAYLGSRQLQAATDASALAGATVLPNAGATIASVTAAANQYSAVATTGNQNIYPNLQNVSMLAGYPQLECLTTLTNQGEACNAPTSANAVTVKTQAYVPLYFANLFGFSSMRITAHSTAAMRGAPNGPFNVVVIVDTTASMGDSDGGSECSGSRLSCALAGVQILLQDLSPCSNTQTTCGSATNGVVPNPVDQVSLMVFPAVTAASAPDAYCGGGRGTGPSSISTQPYATAESPNPYSLTSGPTNTYMIVPFSSDYKTSDTATTLNTASDLVKAVGYAGSGCAGVDSKGGAGTYYAGVIYAAQYALAAQQTNFPTSQNVIIILSDGDATATTPNDFSGTMNGKGTGTLKNNVATFMSNIDECQQAVAAAKYAASQGTSVYSVSYGSRHQVAPVTRLRKAAQTSPE